MKDILIETHALLRAAERGIKFNLSYEETRKRIFDAVRKGKTSRKHHSHKNKTKSLYFNDNFTFYVVFKETKNKIYVKTVIIEEGRE